ncbi:DUF5937 family protein [Lentzea sp. NPDC051208]|uniref:ArsR/SmtB family transcription factor n=1 Tax=Lentzea sp. NPDC051208 TaxID=3154642 RepID=UPI0034465732
MISLRFLSQAEEQVAFTTSALLETVHSWHALVRPGHHALHAPWVRRCRSLPSGLRRLLREHEFMVAGYVPAFFESRADDHEATFDDQLAAVHATAPEELAAELAQTLIDTARYRGHDLLHDGHVRDMALLELAAVDAGRAELLRRVLDDPRRVLDGALIALGEYWSAAFAEQWDSVEPLLHEQIARTGQQIARNGIFSMLRTLIPEIRVDLAQRLLSLDRPHDHEVTVTSMRPVTFTASHFVWPHVRVTCDEPWPLRVTYPVIPLAPAPPAASREDVLRSLRALAAAPRLEILSALAEQSRSTQELASLLGLSQSVVSRHLHQMTQAGLLTTRRDGYYVLYSVDHSRVSAIAAAVEHLGGAPRHQQPRLREN